MTYRTKPATEATAAANAAAAEHYPMGDREDFDDTDRGLVADFADHRVVDEHGKVIFDLGDFDFSDDGPAPDSVNPSLWRQSQSSRRAACTRSSTASTRCARTTSATSRSSRATTDWS